MSSKPADRANPYFRFLRRMHAGGRSNMYGAIPYLTAAFGCGRDEAYRIVCEWVDLQDETREPEDTAPAPAHTRASGVQRPKVRRKAARGRPG